MKNHVPKTHHRFKTIPEVIKLSQCINTQTSYLNFLGYGGIYDNGLDFHLTSNKDWAEHYYKKYLFNSLHVKKRLKTGINYWKKNKAPDIQLIQEDARENFDIDAWIEFTYRDNVNNCYHIYAFTSNKKNAAKAYHFYDFHRAKLLKFIAYFNQTAAHLITEANKPENLIQIPNYNIDDVYDPKRNYAKELVEENKNTELSSREFETMLLYAYGLKKDQIGVVFNKSERTIESQIIKIQQKTNCKDRKSLQLHVRNNGWRGLEQFFFNFEGVPTQTQH